MTRIHTYARVVLIVALTLLAANCGGASLTAPPVELPAPVVGRITVGTPDATGKAMITGAADAVTAGAIVMAVNERLAGAAAAAPLLWQLTDTIISSAHAQELPGICSETGHVCTIAASDGSFMLSIEAVIGDEITLVLINALGDEISEPVTLVVPATALALTDCAGLGVDGGLADVLSVSGAPLGFYRGSESQHNTLVFNGATIALPGCHARDLAVARGTPEDTIIALSNDDGVVWTGSWNGAAFTTAVTAELGVQSLAVESMGSPQHAVIVYAVAGGVAVGRLSLDDGFVDRELIIPISPLYEFRDVVDLSTMGPYNDGNYLGVLTFTAADTSNVVTAFALLFDTERFAVLNENGSPTDLGTLIGLTMDDVADAALTMLRPTVQSTMYLIADHGNGELSPSYVIKGGNTPLYLTDAVGSLSPTFALAYDPAYSTAPAPTGSAPTRIAAGLSGGASTVYSILEDSTGRITLWSIYDYLNTKVESWDTIPDVSDLRYIDADTDTESVVLGDAMLNQTLDASGYWIP